MVTSSCLSPAGECLCVCGHARRVGGTCPAGPYPQLPPISETQPPLRPAIPLVGRVFAPLLYLLRPREVGLL